MTMKRIKRKKVKTIASTKEKSDKPRLGVIDRWQINMENMQASCAYLFNRELYSDVYFLVGKDGEKKRIPAHKFILSCMSPVFGTLFHGSLPLQSNEIDVPDIDADGFLMFLRYIYTGEANLNADTVMSTLYAAKKYDLPLLEIQCEQFLIKNLESDNACLLLTQARHFEESELIPKCLDIIESHTWEALASDGFLDIDLECLCHVLERDNLHINENDLYQAVLRWAEAHCKKQNLPPSPGNQRIVLGKAFNLIRFPMMTAREFTLGPVRSGLLTAEENVGIFQYLCAPENYDLPYINRPRKPIYYIRPFQEKKYPAPSLGDTIVFTVNRSVYLRALEFYGCTKEETSRQYTVSCLIESSEGLCVGSLPTTSVTCETDSETFKVYFNPPIYLDTLIYESQIFSLKSNVTGPTSYYGTRPVSSKTCENVTFTFFTSIHYQPLLNDYQTGGQIAGIIFSE